MLEGIVHESKRQKLTLQYNFRMNPRNRRPSSRHCFRRRFRNLKGFRGVL